MLAFPSLTSANAALDSSLILFYGFHIEEAIYIAHTYTSRVNCISMSALQALKQAWL